LTGEKLFKGENCIDVLKENKACEIDFEGQDLDDVPELGFEFFLKEFKFHLILFQHLTCLKKCYASFLNPELVLQKPSLINILSLQCQSKKTQNCLI